MLEKTIIHAELGIVRLIRKGLVSQLRITVRSSGEIVVTIPWHLSFSRGESFLQEKLEWIRKARRKIEKKTYKSVDLAPGEIFATRNNQYKIVPLKSDRVRVTVHQDKQMVVVGYPEDRSLQQPDIRDKIRLGLEGVLRYEAKRYLPGRARELSVRLGYSFKKLTVKNNKTNWGSCSGLGNINLNLHLMRLPDRLIDFIIVHELVHTEIPNHGPRFHERMKAHFPDRDELDKEIKRFRPEMF